MMRRDYSIPIVDLSQETFRQFEVDREPGLYIGHPTTVLLEDGQTMLAVYPKSHGIGQITLKRSLDGGRTWSERLPVPDSWGTGMEVPTIFRTYGADGSRHLVMFTGVNPIRMSHSEDDGVTWTELETIGDGTISGVVAFSCMICTGPGQYTAFYHDYSFDSRRRNLKRKLSILATGTGTERRTKLVVYPINPDGSLGEPEKHWVKTEDRPGDDWKEIYCQYSDLGPMDHADIWTIFMIKSTDGGLTWGEPEAALTEVNGLHICEPCVIPSPDGKEWAMIMREDSRKANSQVSFSSDQGKTWSKPQELPGALTGDRHTAKYLKDGRLFISFRDMPLVPTPTASNWSAWVGTYDDIRNLREGQFRVMIMKCHDCCDCGYPGVEVQPDGTIVTTTYGHWIKGEQPFVMCVRVHPDELDERLRQQQG